MTQNPRANAADALVDTNVPGRQPVSVVTKMTYSCPPELAWKGLVFYEELGEKPPLYLRLLLPVPIRNVGEVSKVGDEATCLYEGGQLLKRITKIETNVLYEFEVAQQTLSIGAGMRLCGGRYMLRALPNGHTEVSIETRYLSPRWPQWLWAPFEKMVCHWFHRHLLRSMRRQVEAG